MNAKLTIERPGLFTSVQDQGRPGLAFYGIPPCGHMDPLAAAVANRLVGNDEKLPLIECNLLAPAIRFDADALFAVAGADMSWTLDGDGVPRYRAMVAESGAVLQGHYTSNGARAYVAVAGRLRCQHHYGSASTYDYAGLGGLKGTRLAGGDVLVFEDSRLSAPTLPEVGVPDYDAIDCVRFVAGPEWNVLSDRAKEQLVSEPFVICNDSNRMGARLRGPALARDNVESESVPLFPGVLQLPGSGHPIVILQDGQTTGGYPRIAYLPPDELARFCQIYPGRSFRLTQMK